MNIRNTEKSEVRTAILYLFVCTTITLLYSISTFHGNKMSSDSEWYLSIAKNISKKGELVGPKGVEIIYWPPLYPLILSLGSNNLFDFIRVLHLVVFLGSTLTWLSIAREFLSFSALKVYAFFLCLSTPLLMIHVFIWSEAFFLFFLSGYLFFLLKYLNGNGYLSLLVSSIFCFFMILQRNAGFFIALPVTACLIILTCCSYRNFLNYVVHFTIGVSGGALWNYKKLIKENNEHVIGELLPYFSLKRNFFLVFKEIYLLFAPNILTTLFSIILSILMLTVLVLLWKKTRNSFIRVISVLLSFYLFTWIIIPAHVDNISRFIAIILPLLYLVIIYFFQIYRTTLSSAFLKLIVILLVASFLYQGARVGYNAWRWGLKSSISRFN
jgi:hypothetical protein